MTDHDLIDFYMKVAPYQGGIALLVGLVGNSILHRKLRLTATLFLLLIAIARAIMELLLLIPIVHYAAQPYIGLKLLCDMMLGMIGLTSWFIVVLAIPKTEQMPN